MVHPVPHPRQGRRPHVPAALPRQRHLLGQGLGAPLARRRQLPGSRPFLLGQRGPRRRVLAGERLHDRLPGAQVGRVRAHGRGALLRRLAPVRQRVLDAGERAVPLDGAYFSGLRPALDGAQDHITRLSRRQLRRVLRRHLDDLLPPDVPGRRRRRPRGVGADRLLRSGALEGPRRRRLHLQRHHRARLRRRGAGLPGRHRGDDGRVERRVAGGARRPFSSLRRDGAGPDARGALAVRARVAAAARLPARRRVHPGLAREPHVPSAGPRVDGRGAATRRGRGPGHGPGHGRRNVLPRARRGPRRRARRRAGPGLVGLPVVHGELARIFLEIQGARLHLRL